MAKSTGARCATARLRTIALIGIDGSGKTTQAYRLAETLTAAGYPATYHRNAGGRRWLGRAAHRLGRPDAQGLVGLDGMLVLESVLRWLAIAMALLGGLLTGRVAVMDRYAACQYASLRAQGGRRWERLVRAGYQLFPRPQVTFLLAVDPAEAYRRIERRGTDHESLGYLTAADLAYRTLPEYPTFVVIDASRRAEDVAREIQGHLAGWLAAGDGPAGRGPVRSKARMPGGASGLVPAQAWP
ncbi:thymidylate kinase [Micromonospora craterilacus]|uniref:Thymidylate kinase n=1 Tax=Micromonospora craterilacus TaxID=1655439 RepID=A0A2W2DXQ2_9ACTN|nr:thymidylate kinase [Micromonospora craterilacus]PZG14921.1 thymidylate kinase [Micromonospora craterilacus]